VTGCRGSDTPRVDSNCIGTPIKGIRGETVSTDVRWMQWQTGVLIGSPLHPFPQVRLMYLMSAATQSVIVQEKAAAGAALAVDTKGKAKGGKKVSAAVLAIQREIEERRRADEMRESALAAAKAEEAEMARREEDELRRAAEDKAARAEAKKAKREQLRKEGKLLSAKQKEEAAKLAARRAEFEALAKVCVGKAGPLRSARLLELLRLLGSSLAARRGHHCALCGLSSAKSSLMVYKTIVV
jgi:hypothetical protein